MGVDATCITTLWRRLPQRPGRTLLRQLQELAAQNPDQLVRVISQKMAGAQGVEALVADLKKAKPAAAKGQYVKKITVSSTMGPGLAVDQSSVAALA